MTWNSRNDDGRLDTTYLLRRGEYFCYRRDTPERNADLEFPSVNERFPDDGGVYA